MDGKVNFNFCKCRPTGTPLSRSSQVTNVYEVPMLYIKGCCLIVIGFVIPLSARTTLLLALSSRNPLPDGVVKTHFFNPLQEQKTLSGCHYVDPTGALFLLVHAAINHHPTFSTNPLAPVPHRPQDPRCLSEVRRNSGLQPSCIKCLTSFRSLSDHACRSNSRRASHKVSGDARASHGKSNEPWISYFFRNLVTAASAELTAATK